MSVVGASGPAGVALTDSWTVRATDAWLSLADRTTLPVPVAPATGERVTLKVALEAVDETGAIRMPALASSVALVVAPVSVEHRLRRYRRR